MMHGQTKIKFLKTVCNLHGAVKIRDI